MDRNAFDQGAAKHRIALTLDMHLASAEGAVAEVRRGWYERWDTELRQAALKSLAALRQEIGLLMLQLEDEPHDQLQLDRCGATAHYPNGMITTCVLPGIHIRFDVDHEDRRGTRWAPLVSWSTIREVQAVQDARDRGEIQ